MKKYHIILILTFIISGCDSNLSYGVRSGTLDDDYIEEPISNLANRYENALNTSNVILEKIIQKNFSHIQKNHIHKDVSEIITGEAIQKVILNTVNLAGPIITYKEMQWGFVPLTENNNNYLLSFKIVEHEKGRLNYKFVFKNDGKYEKIVGIYIKSYNPVRQPNEV